MEKRLGRSRLLVTTAISALAISALANIAFGQVTTGTNVSTRGPRDVGRTPFMADEFTETTQILLDGNRITRKSLVKVYRDGEGRTRREMYRSNSQGVPDDSPTSVEIFDRVAGVSYLLDPRTHTARKRDLRGRTNPRSANTTGPTPHQPIVQTPPETTKPEYRREPLGSQMIEGFNTEGTRVTTVIPAGAQGNERPLEIVHESWFSHELGIDLLTKHDDPFSGQRVTQVTNIRLEEPSPDLFRVPPDYALEETTTVPPPQTKPDDNK